MSSEQIPPVPHRIYAPGRVVGPVRVHTLRIVYTLLSNHVGLGLKIHFRFLTNFSFPILTVIHRLSYKIGKLLRDRTIQEIDSFPTV